MMPHEPANCQSSRSGRAPSPPLAMPGDPSNLGPAYLRGLLREEGSIMPPRLLFALILGIAGLTLGRAPATAVEEKTLRAGAAAVDVSPRKYPVIVNGGFL